MIKFKSGAARFEQIVSAYLNYAEHNKIYNKQESHLKISWDEMGIPCFDYLDKESIRKHPSSIICIDNLDEGVNAVEHFSDYPKDKHYVIFSNGDWDPKTKLPISYDIVPWYIFLYRYYINYTLPFSPNYFVDYNHNFDCDKDYLFCSLIGVQKPERDMLVEKITGNLSDCKYILKYAGQELGESSELLDVWHQEHYKKIISPEDFAQHTIIVDSFDISDSIPVNLYNKCRFCLVVETNNETFKEFHLTEKLVKILLVGMPFVISSSPGYIEKINSMGFLTYDDIWDESYDSITDTETRYDAIIQLVKNLNRLDWNANKNKLEYISRHNKNNLNKIIKENLLKQILHFEKVFDEIQKRH